MRADLTDDVLIIANPGTGKTTALATRVAELLAEGAKEEDILCITFTEKAAQEMKNKIASVVKDKKLTHAKPHKIDVHTFHSYAYSYLQDHGEPSDHAGNNVIRYSIFKSFEKNKAFNYGKEYLISEIVPKCENAIRYLKSFGILPGDIDIKEAGKILAMVYKEEEISNVTEEEISKFMGYFVDAFKDYETEKDTEGKYIDYNDMLLHFIKKYDKSAKHYKFVLVDELQDVNELEAEIAVNSGDSLFLVGDRKQAIFGFQGGGVRNFKEFMKRKGMKSETKTLNYRSYQEILDYSKTHFLSNTTDKSYGDELKGLKSSKPGKGKVCVIVSKDPEKAAIAKLTDLLNRDKKDTEKTYAIITRTNGQIIDISKSLDSKGIDYSTTVGGYTSDVAKNEIISYLRGLLYNDPEAIQAALFTPFAGVTLKEAFEISEKMEKKDMEYAEKHAKGFFADRNGLTIDKIPKLFQERMMPIALSIGKEYYLTATAIYNSAVEYFGFAKAPNARSFFDYLAITEEDYEPIEKKHRVTLTTVHKAKGLEFDTVIYAPKNMRDKISFIDAVVYSIIKAAKGIDIRDELEEEHLRVDFVAFTRAKSELYIAAKDRQAEDYQLDGLCDSETYEADEEKEPLSWKYDEAYALFVNGRHEDAKKLLVTQEKWLMDVIRGYFQKKDRLSFSLVEAAQSPYEFLKNDILRLREYRAEALQTGTQVHEFAERMFKTGLKDEDVPEEYKKFVENIRSIDSTIKSKYNAKQIDAEHSVIEDIKSMFGDLGVAATFKANIDAIYEIADPKGGPKYLILDYKTDRSAAYSADHRRQLAVYRKIYAVEKGIDEKDILVALGFVGLRGNINTGKMGCLLDEKQPEARQFKTFAGHVGEFVAYKKDPKEFVKALLNEGSNEPLYARIAAQISVENK
jgi:DNA helicase-2/ATP-dependent DNA helicase PcrA